MLLHGSTKATNLPLVPNKVRPALTVREGSWILSKIPLTHCKRNVFQEKDKNILYCERFCKIKEERRYFESQ